MNLQNALHRARQLDAVHADGSFRSHFIIPPHNGSDALYFLGNSLGLQPKRTAVALQQVLEQWGHLGVEGFFRGGQPWLQYHQQLTATLSRIVGALPHEVVAMNSLTVNLHLLLVSFYQPAGRRTKIICEAKAFPSDQYMLWSHVRQRGLNPEEVIVEIAPRNGEVLLREEDILAAIDENKDDLALLFLGGVNYYTGQLFNMEKLTLAARSVGAAVGYDLAHAAGNVPLQLHQWGVDFAAWCSYKYLNAGPGGIGGAFVHERHHNHPLLQRFAGWWGNEKSTQFLMHKEFVPEPSAEGWQLSTPSPLLYASLKAALDVFEEAGVAAVLQQNKKLNDFLWQLLAEVVKTAPPGTIKIFTPVSPEERGCQVSMAVKNGRQVFAYLTHEGVFADWREPDVIRLAPVSLYNTFEELCRFAQILQAALHTFAA